ncbi:MAG: hypothetical protein K2G88_06255 [Oscillospiraceae bacterium]|nr:hypothetical protein [Oscillospiraceae bacterium]
MDMQMIASLFSLFSGEHDTHAYLPLLISSSHEVKSVLREGCSESDVRLCYLVASIANLRYVQIYGAREKALATYAGTIARKSDSEHQARFAEQLVNSYRNLCRDLLTESQAFLLSVKG